MHKNYSVGYARELDFYEHLTIDEQITFLIDSGVNHEKIYIEKTKDQDTWTALNEALWWMRKGDTFSVCHPLVIGVNFGHQLKITEQLKNEGIIFYPLFLSVGEQKLDVSSSFGRFALHMMMAFSSHEYSKIREFRNRNTKKGLMLNG